MLLTFDGCPAGRGRQKKYGVKPNEKRPCRFPQQSTSFNNACPLSFRPFNARQ